MRALIIAGLALGISATNANAQNAKLLQAAMAACGPGDALFKVRLIREAGPAPIPESQAVVYVIGSSVHFGNGPGAPILRVGVDGSWVGAVKATYWSSYIATPLNAGVHHFCVQWQGPADSTTVAVNVLNVKAGSSYWLVAEGLSAVNTTPVLTLEQLNADEGKLLIAEVPSAVASSKKAEKP